MSDPLLRQWEMLKLIPRERKITVKELHFKLEKLGFPVTRRTIERDLDSLSRPFSLEVDNRSKPYGWRFAVNMKFPGIPSLTSSEALTLIMIESYLKNVLPVAVTENLAHQFSAARDFFFKEHPDIKLQDWLNKVCVLSPGQPLLAPDTDYEIQRTVYDALLAGQQLEMTYLSTQSTEVRHFDSVHLHGLVQYGVVIYMVVTINDYSDLRLLALHRVRSVLLKTDPITPVANYDLQKYINAGAFGFGEIGKSIVAELKFFNGAGNHLIETRLSEDQLVNRIDTETLVLTATVMQTTKFSWWLCGFGPDVEVLAPQSLRDSIADRLSRASERYI